MSVALERGGDGIGRPGFIGDISRFVAYESAELCSSSIGRNSDSSGGGSDGGYESEEVQSILKGPLDTMDALEDSLPISRGVSKFYRGKSKSLASLTDAFPSSRAKDLVKPEDSSYTRKRKNLLALSTVCGKTHRNSQRDDGDDAAAAAAAGFSKRPVSSTRTKECNSHPENSSSGSNSYSNGSSDEDRGHYRQLPPLHPHGKLTAPRYDRSSTLERLFFPMRSFSSPDLELADKLKWFR